MYVRVTQQVDRRAEAIAVRLLIGFCAIAAIGVILGRLVTGPFDPWVTRHLDAPVRAFAISHANPTALRAARDVSTLGSAPVTGVLAISIGAMWCRYVRDSRPALLLGSAFAGAVAIAVVVKYLVHRAPASGPIARLTPGTFPSGHTLFASAVYGAVALLVLRTRRSPAFRVGVAALLLAVPIAVAAARLYLLDHFLSDAIGSVVLGALWVTGIALVLGRGFADAHD